MVAETYFVDIIIPLALPRTLTYRVPREWNANVFVGQRVVAQLGKNRLYTGIINSIHQQAPSTYTAKYIDHLLDETPIVNANQLLLWDWMAGYYKCTLGEVMNAALPGGLKLSSESVFVLHENFNQEQALSAHEEQVVNALYHRHSLNLQEIGNLLDLKRPQSLVKSMIQKNILVSEEELKEKFRPKKADFVHLHPEYADEEKLRLLFDELEKRRAQKQVEALMMFLKLSNYDGKEKQDVEKLKLQEAARINASVINAMCEKHIFFIESREIGRLQSHLLASQSAPILSGEQQRAFEEIRSHFSTKDITLLHGVTGSGKTEIYIRLIEEQLEKGNQVLFLLPEIALTTQIISRLRKYFGRKIGVYHSGYNDHERTEVWNKVLSDIPGEYDIILGARSSIFLPFSRLGLVIVDEEHEPSFKQHDPAPRYHARDTAIYLAALFKAKVLLGSATPAIETYYNATQRRYGLVELSERYGGLALPEVLISDLRAETKAKKMDGSFSGMLVREMQQAIQAGEQIILFQNRRGYSPFWQCQTCGWVPMCTRCDVSLTYHKGAHQLKCHYCGYHTSPPEACNACGSTELKMLGAGTQKIEEEIKSFLPDARVQRMDLDTTRNKSSYQNIISDFESGEIQILVGTQMVTKGLDFDNVSLVGIINADKMMNFPDFRSMERSFQLMMQVAGRSGRKHKRGKVVIQTFQPEHWLLQMVTNGSYTEFYQHEIVERQHFGYPPIVRLIKVTLKHKEDAVVQRACEWVSKQLKPELGGKLLGPEQPMVPRVNNYFLWQFLIKLEKNPQLTETKEKIAHLFYRLHMEEEFKSVRITIDVDPV